MINNNLILNSSNYPHLLKKYILENKFKNNIHTYNEIIIPFVNELCIFKNNFKKYILENDLISIKKICNDIKNTFNLLNTDNLFNHIIEAIDGICNCESENILDYKKKFYFFTSLDYNDIIHELTYESMPEKFDEDEYEYCCF
jgi:hypothetical protein